MHHAYYIEGALGDFEPLEVAHAITEKFERFGIDEARTLIERSTLRNPTEVVYVLEVAAITTEAQQALLKLFEEPSAGTTFIVVAPHGMLLPTLRSRMLPYPSLTKRESASPQQKKFMRSSPKERSAQVTALLKDDEDQRARVRSFLNELERELHASLGKTKDRVMLLAALGDIAKVRSYVGDRSPSLKMLLEHLALSVPTL